MSPGMAAPRTASSDPGAALTTTYALHDAEHLAAALPGLMTAANRVAHTVAQGLHGRRRPGIGETFWEYRNHRDGDMASMIDWRKSARTDRLFIREREWEAVNTVWFWANTSASMRFQSSLAPVSKLERAIVLALANAELLVRGGERIGAFNSGMTPSTSRHAVRRLAEYFVAQTAQPDQAADHSLPPKMPPARFSNIVLFSDFFEPIKKITQRISAIAARDVRGHLVQIVDPAEETLPYQGRTQFLSMDRNISATFSRIEALRGDYAREFETHRLKLARLARRIGWSFTVHRTDTPAQAALLALYQIMADNIELHGGSAALTPQAPAAASRPATMVEPGVDGGKPGTVET